MKRSGLQKKLHRIGQAAKESGLEREQVRLTGFQNLLDLCATFHICEKFCKTLVTSKPGLNPPYYLLKRFSVKLRTTLANRMKQKNEGNKVRKGKKAPCLVTKF